MEGIAGLASIIIPTHNRASDLRRAVRSVLQQSYQHLEILIIANGCRDDTTQLVNELKGEDQSHRIVYLEFMEILGGAKARNIGIDKARGEYIAFLDDDDFWPDDKLATQIEMLNSDQYSIASTNNIIYVYDIQGEQYKFSRGTSRQIIKVEDLYYENKLHGFSFCTTKKAYINSNRINEDLDALQDWDLWLKILISSGLPACIAGDQTHVYYRIGWKRLSSNYHNVAKAQKIFLHNWRFLLAPPAVNYHKMRTACLELKIRQRFRISCYLVQIGMICKAVFYSPSRYNLKRYIHYMLLPVVNIDMLRIRLWAIFTRQS